MQEFVQVQNPSVRLILEERFVEPRNDSVGTELCDIEFLHHVPSQLWGAILGDIAAKPIDLLLFSKKCRELCGIKEFSQFLATCDSAARCRNMASIEARQQ